MFRKPTNLQLNILAVMAALAVFVTGIVAVDRPDNWKNIIVLPFLVFALYAVHTTTRLTAPFVSLLTVAFMSTFALQLGFMLDSSGKFSFLWFFSTFSAFFFSLFLSFLVPSRMSHWWYSLSVTAVAWVATFVSVPLGTWSSAVGLYTVLVMFLVFKLLVPFLRRKYSKSVSPASDSDVSLLSNHVLKLCQDDDSLSVTYEKAKGSVVITRDAESKKHAKSVAFIPLEPRDYLDTTVRLKREVLVTRKNHSVSWILSQYLGRVVKPGMRKFTPVFVMFGDNAPVAPKRVVVKWAGFTMKGVVCSFSYVKRTDPFKIVDLWA